MSSSFILEESSKRFGGEIVSEYVRPEIFIVVVLLI
jgi:hypothetical protein